MGELLRWILPVVRTGGLFLFVRRDLIPGGCVGVFAGLGHLARILILVLLVMFLVRLSMFVPGQDRLGLSVNLVFRCSLR